MFNHLTYGIRVGDTLDPAEVKNVQVWYRRTGRTNRGIEGTEIDLLRLMINGEITAWYSSGKWSIPIHDPHSEAALKKLLEERT